MSVLKAQLFELERAAETLERIVYNQLTALMSLPDREVEKYEARVLRKLEKLDELQDEIDAVVAKLKEAGEYQPVRHTGNVYEYRPPKYEKPKPKPKPKKPRKVYPVQSPTPAKRKARTKPKPKPKSVRPPKAKPIPRPKAPAKSAELLKAERGVYDAILDRQKQDAIFEGKRLKAEQNIATAKERLQQYADVSSADGGNMQRRWAKELLWRNEAKLKALPELKAKRLRELDERQARYEAEVQRLTANASQ